MSRARRMAAYTYEMDTEHFANRSLSVTVVKCFGVSSSLNQERGYLQVHEVGVISSWNRGRGYLQVREVGVFSSWSRGKMFI